MSPKLMLPVTARDHTRGSPGAPVMLVEYGDYECSHCAAAHRIVNEIRDQLGPNLDFVFRNFPLPAVHPHAIRAAESAEAAGGQRKFWEMHDLLFATQENLEDMDLLADTQILGLDIDQFEYDLFEHRYLPRVQEDFNSGVRSGVNGTPSFFINGIRHNGRYDRNSLLAAITAAMNG